VILDDPRCFRPCGGRFCTWQRFFLSSLISFVMVEAKWPL
jgi:hypothetical protein